MMEIGLFKRCSFLLLISSLAVADASPSALLTPVVDISATHVVDGALIRLTATFPQGTSATAVDDLSAEFEDQKVFFYPIPGPLGAAPGVYAEALLGIPHNHKPGVAQITVHERGADKVLDLSIEDANYPSETLKVDPRKVNPNKKDLIQIERDIKEVGKIYSNVRREKLWTGPFVMPVDSKVTSVYGTKRVFNGKMQSYHNGLDLKAPMSTPVHAAAAGIVVLAKSLFFTGNTVLIDHGYGLITLYAHMSKLNVHVGDKVAAGDLLGLSGMTGRANGPHLHWGVIVNKVKVNPAEAVRVIR